MIKSKRMRWAGHVARMEEKRNAYRILVGRPEEKRPLGRPRRRWVDNIKMSSSGMWRYEDHGLTDVSFESIVSPPSLGEEAMRSSKTSVKARSKHPHIQEDILHSHRCENLKSYTILK
jgi:hypothetical protein